jgi:hypothetical protein
MLGGQQRLDTADRGLVSGNACGEEQTGNDSGADHSRGQGERQRPTKRATAQRGRRAPRSGRSTTQLNGFIELFHRVELSRAGGDRPIPLRPR